MLPYGMKTKQIDIEILIQRQRALNLFWIGIVLGFVFISEHAIFWGFPLPSCCFYLPVLPAFLIMLSAWIYPTYGLSFIRRSLRFYVRIAATAMLAFAPFSLWLMEFPDRHYFQVTTVFYYLAGAVSLALFARFMAHAGRPNHLSRLMSNYVFYATLFLMVLPLFIYFIYVASLPGAYFSVLRMIPYWVFFVCAHPMVLMVGLLFMWHGNNDCDLPEIKNDEDEAEASLYVKAPHEQY